MSDDAPTTKDPKPPSNGNRKLSLESVIGIAAAAIVTTVLGGGGLNVSAKIEQKLDAVLSKVSSLEVKVVSLEAKLDGLERQDLGRRVHDLELEVIRIKAETKAAPK